MVVGSLKYCFWQSNNFRLLRFLFITKSYIFIIPILLIVGSKKTKMSTKTITRCIEKLNENEGIQFTLVYDPVKIEDYIPHAVLAWIEKDLKKTLQTMNKTFSESYLQIPFIAKNQIVLFLYSQSIFKMDELTQKVRSIKNVKSADLFIPKKISFYGKWLEKAIEEFKKSPKLHLTYQTN